VTSQELPGVAVFGRPLKPVALGLTLTMAIVARANWLGLDRGTQPPLSYVLGVLAAIAAATLVTGWAGRMQRVAEAGLLLVVLTYATRAAFVTLSNPGDQAAYFSLATVIIAGGSYILETTDRGRGRRAG